MTPWEPGNPARKAPAWKTTASAAEGTLSPGLEASTSRPRLTPASSSATAVLSLSGLSLSGLS